MLNFIHRPAQPWGWTYESPGVPGISGMARSIEESVDSANHAARVHLTRRLGFSFDLAATALQVTHAVVGELGDGPAGGAVAPG